VIRLIFPLLILFFLHGTENTRGTAAGAQKKTLETLDGAALSRLITHRGGKALLINVWATWCDPCVEEFPDLVALDREYRSKNVDIVSVNIDDSDDIESKVLPFLHSQKSSMKTYTNGFKKPEDFINALNPSWSGAVPATIIFDSSGKRREFLIGRQSLDSLKSKLAAAVGR